MSPIDQMICRIQFRKASYDGFYTPPTADRHSIEYPGYNGGSDWGGDRGRSASRRDHRQLQRHAQLQPAWCRAPKPTGSAGRRAIEVRGDMGGAEGAGDPQDGTPYAINVNAGWRMPFTGLLCKQPPYGGIRAIDLATGKTLWDRPFGTARAQRTVRHSLAAADRDRHAEQRRLGGDRGRPGVHRRGHRRPDPRDRHRHRRDRVEGRAAGGRPGQRRWSTRSAAANTS